MKFITDTGKTNFDQKPSIGTRARQVTHCDRDAATRLFTENEKLAFFALYKFFPLLPWNDAEDVISIAYIGLWKACQSYNPARGYRFSTFAVHIMLNEFKRSGMLRSEEKRQGDYVDGKPRLVSLNAHYGKDESDTFGDVILVAGEDSDPLAVLLHREELDAARAKYDALPPSVKARHAGRGQDLAALYGTEPPPGDPRVGWRTA